MICGRGMSLDAGRRPEVKGMTEHPPAVWSRVWPRRREKNDDRRLTSAEESETFFVISRIHTTKVVINFGISHCDLSQYCFVAHKTRTITNPWPHPFDKVQTLLLRVCCWCGRDFNRPARQRWLLGCGAGWQCRSVERDVDVCVVTARRAVSNSITEHGAVLGPHCSSLLR